MTFLDRLRGQSSERMTVDEYAKMVSQFSFNGLSYGMGLNPVIQQTLAGQATVMAPNNYVGLATQAYGANSVVFACMLVRQMLFSTVRFQWQRLRNGTPSGTYGSADLALLEKPWPGGTTQDLLSKMIQHADLGGNSYVADLGNELVCMRPDWVDIVVEERQGGVTSMYTGGQVGWRKVGYLYWEGGRGVEKNPTAFLADEVAHFMPIPDPLFDYRGMSWLTPILREIQADQAMTTHQSKFFEQGATPNMIIKHSPGADRDAVQKWAEEVNSKHSGAANAYKTLNLYPGADATVVGTNLKDIDFAEVREGGEVRVAMAAGVPPVIVGLAKGLDSATYSNYSQARRRLADGTAHPLWQNLSGSLQQIITPRDSASRLWYDTCDVPFLREDEKDEADIQAVRAATINTLITAGFTPESSVAAVESGDFGLLQHTGLTSVQLLPPGTTQTPPASTDGGSNGNQ
ncbi:phage portal protein [Mycolicibacterium llatzerense]|uniref:phage portal protein n=1 Tax=Mycolicibacterium llatzerense TaxID=280871 RepID=UPI0021B5A46B|nr:phage portal protein [Mycolicibacterium llatzerense]